MDIRIIKGNVRYCTVCKEVYELNKNWEEEQELLVENGEQEEPVPFPGVSGYTIKDADEYKFGTTEICEKCMNAIIKGVNLINLQKLTGVSIDSNK